MNRIMFLICMALLCPNKNSFAQKNETQKIILTGEVVDSLTGRGIEYPTVALFTDSLKIN